ncbi:MAG: TIGR03905 family TSCPD domain-containing protein [Parasporobacterium sp.]|nr:TIGR03905 family TSCPD domain-containing protein [Parasporobacterium sp.]
MRYSYKTSGTCARQINFDLEGNVVTNIEFVSGCPGNTKAVAILCDGMTVEDINAKLRGNQCGVRGTSCADQLAIAVQTAYDQSK